MIMLQTLFFKFNLEFTIIYVNSFEMNEFVELNICSSRDEY